MYAVLSKKNLQILLCVIFLLTAFFVEGHLISNISDKNDMRDEGARLDFLQNIGIQVDKASLNCDTVTIPSKFGDVYENYNLLQKQAGYDLSEYKGKTVTRYTYSVSDYSGDDNVTVNLLCYGGKIIGGDICSAALDGFMLPLK